MFLRTSIYCYLVILSFTSAFSLGPWFPLPIVILLVVIAIALTRLLISPVVDISCFKSEDILIVIMFIGLFASSIITYNSKTINYLLAYVFVFGVGYLFLKAVVFNYCDIQQLLLVNIFAVTLVATFVLLDFIGFNYVGIDLQSLIPRSTEPLATYLATYRRSYGFSTEPTILAFYFNTLGVIGTWSLWYRTSISALNKMCLTMIFFGAWLTTFSAAGFASLILAGCICYVMTHSAFRHFYRNVVFLSVFVGLGWTILLSDLDWRLISPIIDKVTLQQQYLGSRPLRWQEGIEQFMEAPFLGHGLGSISAAGEGSTVNWYIFLSIEGGLISSIPIILFMIVSFLRISRSRAKGRLWFMVAFLAGAIHMMAISTFYHGFLWVLLIIFFCYRKECAQRACDQQNVLEWADGRHFFDIGHGEPIKD